MQVLFSGPTGSNIRTFLAESSDVLPDRSTYFCGKLDGNEKPPHLVRLLIPLTHYFAGVMTTVSFVAASTAALLKGKALGVTLRQSSS